MSREVKYTLTVDSRTGKANLGGFERQAQSTTKALQDQGKVVDSSASSFSNFGKVITAVGGIAAAFSLVSMTKQFVGLAMAQQDAEIAMSSALKVTGEYTDQLNKKFQDFASSIQAVTTYGDEEVLKLMALQKNLGVSTNRLEEAAKMSIGLAAATGRNAESMAMYIALAEQGEYTMLNRYIPALRAAETDTEKLQVLTDFTARGFEVAKSKTETFSGAVKQTSNTFGDLKEKVGDFVVKNAVAVEAVKVADDLFREWQEEVKKTADQFNRWAEINRDFIKLKVKETLIQIKDAGLSIWKVISYDPAILEFGLVGLLIWGKKGAVILGALGHAKTWVENLAAALGLASAGVVEFSEIATANFKELEAIVDNFDQKAVGSSIFRKKISFGGSETGAEFVNTEDAIAPDREIEQAKIDLWMQSRDAWLLMEDQKLTASYDFLQRDVELEKKAASAKQTIQGNVLNNTVRLMMALGIQNEKFTALGIAISTAAEMVRAYQAAVAASTLAFASQLIPGDPTSFARATAAAATAMSWGLANVALIGAAGIASGLSALSGSTGGSVGNVASISDATTALSQDLSTTTEEKRGELHIHLEGDVLADEYYIELLAEKISEAVEDRDVKLTATYSNKAGAVA